MNPALRHARLAASLIKRAPLRAGLLVMLVAVAVVVFLVVSQLSAASQEGLDDAIENEVGVAGTYSVSLSTTMSQPRAVVKRALVEALEPLSARPLVIVDQTAPVRPQCPPYEDVGEFRLAVVTDSAGRPLPVGPVAPDSPVTGDICLRGLVVPAQALRGPTDQERAVIGETVLVLDAAYLDEVTLDTGVPPRVTVVVRTGDEAVGRDIVFDTAVAAVEDFAVRAGLSATSTVVVNRLDSGGSIRAASQGVKVVYGIIGWGVLLLGGLAVLIVEMMIVRDRTWFYALARATGATRLGIVSLVVLDVLIVLAVAGLVAILLAVLAQPSIADFTEQAFEIRIRLLTADVVPTLLGGALLVLLVGSLYPAWRAAKIDPQVVLDSR